MLNSEEIIRILLAILLMLIGVFIFRFAYKVTASKTPYRLFSFQAPELNEKDQIIRYNAMIGRSFNTFALICLGSGALLAYIPNITLSISVVAVFIIFGILYVLYCYRKARTMDQHT